MTILLDRWGFLLFIMKLPLPGLVSFFPHPALPTGSVSALAFFPILYSSVASAASAWQLFCLL